uniref:Uncharacterized protein n=1 Tax=Mycena chlorophos TaxID=658473 RepID=A0ABQ0LBH1_MYCCL|nr:predicted protein [Mycena chlorophos]
MERDLTKPLRPLIVHQLDHPESSPEPDDTNNTPQHDLRRKKSFYRVSAPAQAQSPVAEVAVAIEIPKAAAVTRPQSMISPGVAHKPAAAAAEPPYSPSMTHARSYSQPSTLRLGHSKRPLYSAIRSNMSRPSSPSPPTSRPTSPALLPRLTLEVEGEDTEDIDDENDNTPVISPRRSNSRFRIGFGSSAPAGFSVSGEMEMRMALADLARESRRQEALEAQQRAEQAAQAELPHHDSGKGSVGRRVKKLRKGLRDLVRWKAP